MMRFVLTSILLAAGPAAAAAETIRVLPRAMIGTWGYEARACTTETDDGRVEVAARSVTFFASHCSFSRLHARGDGTITGQGRCRDEGETTTRRASLRLRLEGARLAIATDGGEEASYRRCARSIPVR
jgi:hypothetical protein